MTLRLNNAPGGAPVQWTTPVVVATGGASGVSSPARPPVQVRGLACDAGERRLFENVNLDVAAGGVALVLGANGSGKSTLLRVLAGLRDGAAGSVRVEGPVVYLGHALGLKPALTGTDHLRFWNASLGDDPFGVRLFADLRVGVLSRGQRQRLALSRLATGDGAVWLLDEPTGPLDSEGEDKLAAEIDRHVRGGGAAIIATHRPLRLETPAIELRLS